MHPSYGHIKTPIRFLLHNSSNNLSRLSIDKPYGGTPAQKSKQGRSQASKKSFDFEIGEVTSRRKSAKQKASDIKQLIPCKEIKLNFVRY